MKQFFYRAIAAVTNAVGPRELGLLIGLLMIGYGAGLVWLPAGLFLPGAVLLYISIFGLKT